MSDGKNRSLSIPAHALDQFKDQAARRGVSVSAWLVEAGERQRRREMAAEYLALLAQPEIAEQLAPFRALQADALARWQQDAA